MIKTKSLLIIYLKIIKNRFLNFKAGITFAKNSYVWRHYNSHNEVAIGNNFIFENVSVGKGSYGILEVYDYGTQNEKLVIGNFVSIGDNAKFLLGGNHQLKTFTTFPLKSKFGNKPNPLDATTNGPIIIEDEVWIGLNVIILSGVTIGRGAIIAAGSVVTKDIPPYTIFGGNPAKKIKDRFSPDLIKKLNRIWIKDFDQSTIMENIELFYCDLENSIDEILKLKVK